MINLTNIRQIANGDDLFIKGILEVFLQKEKEYKAAINADWSQRDFEALRQSIHKLKSSMSVLGMKEYRQRLHALEIGLEGNLLSEAQIELGVAEALQLFDTALNEVRDTLREFK
ncbi:MAG TPA: Hpt domain-containing protein [Luteibaculaceae bacterium]|nr:Hpt domain-containing protein [Luteibaculaceae bacterium]